MEERDKPRKLKDLGIRLVGSAAIASASLISLVENTQKAEADPGSEVTITFPEEGYISRALGAAVEWTAPSSVTQMEHQVIPFNNDGPSADLYISDPNWVKDGNFGISRPTVSSTRVNSCFLLPDMGYTWRVRASSSPTAVDPKKNDGWGPWAERSFRTPVRTSETIVPVGPQPEQVVDSRTPKLIWNNPNQRDGSSDVYYYELQLSRDPNFETDPAKATASVTWELINACVTNPAMSYQVRKEFPLEPGVTYYWRLRPRVQGDGTPVDWSTSWSFKTTAAAKITAQETNPIQLMSESTVSLFDTPITLKSGDHSAILTKEGILYNPTRPNRAQRRHKVK